MNELVYIARWTFARKSFKKDPMSSTNYPREIFCEIRHHLSDGNGHSEIRFQGCQRMGGLVILGYLSRNRDFPLNGGNLCELQKLNMNIVP